MKFLWALILSLCVSWAAAQSPYEFFYNNALAEDDARPPDVDNELFMRDLRGDGSTFEKLAEFNFSFTRWSRRGHERWMDERRWGGARLNGLVSHTVDYQLFSVLKEARGEAGYGGRARSLVREGGRVQALAFNRKGRGGARFSYGGEIAGRNTYAGVSLSHRAGRDPRIGGVFMDESSVLGAVDVGDFSVAVAALRSSNGLRGYATNEVFQLTGDKYYNPSWGWWNDEQRSSRTVKQQSLNVLAMWSGAVGIFNHTVSAGFRAGRLGRGGLAWFDAASPYPDYYRYMPDYEPVNSPDGWLIGDHRVTQIYWEQLVVQNLNRPEQAAYIVEKRVEDAADFRLSAHGEAELKDGWSVSYNIDFQHDTRTRYKQLDDLLGAKPFRDVDWHLHGDEIFGTQDMNNVRDPGRLVDEGGRFGYAYRLVAAAADVHAAADYRSAGLHLRGGLGFGGRRIQRHGEYEKELFPGNLSYGKSRSYVFNPWTFDMSAGWIFSPGHAIYFSGCVAEIAPFADNIFLNPDYSNIVMEGAKNIKLYATELNYRKLWDRFGVSFSAFWTATRDESAIYRYWDDIAETYSDMAVNQIVKRYYGVEFGVDWEISPRFSFLFGAAAGKYMYSADAQAVITDDATREIIPRGVGRVRLKGYRLATAPERVATAEIQYDNWGWIASLSASYAGGRYVAASPLRRMERAYGLAGSPEAHREFVMQEKLPDAFELSLFVLRSLDIGSERITLTFAVDNLLGTGAIYHGYEQMRLERSGGGLSETRTPFQSKYLYNYGRTYYVSAIYAF